MMQVAVRVGMSLADFLEQSAQSEFELIDGERRPKLPPVYGHSRIIRLIMRLLDAYVTSRNRGENFSETTFIMPDAYDSDWVKGSRIPDIMYYDGERVRQYLESTPDSERKPLALVPDFVIEIVSPNDKFSDVVDKAECYLLDGVRLVWVIDMQGKRALVFEPDAESLRKLKGDALLTAEDLLPGFALKLSDLFV
jgi:Uma2 family endonuclease